MKNKKIHKGTLFIAIGLLLFAAAFLLAAYNVLDELRASLEVHDVVAQLDTTELKEKVRKSQSVNQIVVDPGEMEIPDYQLNPEMDMPKTPVADYEYVGLLEIPSFGLKLPVISEWSYPALRVSPCRYSGSPYTDDFVISAHNYRSHFGCLKDLAMGEEICFTDLDGNKFAYEVVERTTLNPEDTKTMIDSEWDLTLFTCTIGGQYRVTVRCVRKG